MIDLDFDSIEQRIAYEDGGDVVFGSQLKIMENGQAALPERERAVDAFAQAREKVVPTQVGGLDLEEVEE